MMCDHPKQSYLGRELPCAGPDCCDPSDAFFHAYFRLDDSVLTLIFAREAGKWRPVDARLRQD